MLTAGVLGILGDAPTADAWWSDGGEFNVQLQTSGALQTP
jgi:hypothetical protein